MVMKQAELSKRFYKKQKLQKLANKILEDWQRNPNSSHSIQDIKQQIDNICDLPRSWGDAEYEKALNALESFKADLHSAPLAVSNIPKLTDLIIASLNMVNAGAQDKASAMIDAFYRVQGFSALENMYEYLGDIIKQEHDRQTVVASLQGFYDPSNVNTDDKKTRISSDRVKFKL